jgi:hypothetical protein
MEIEEGSQISLAPFIEIAQIKSEHPGQHQKNQYKHIGQRR